MSWNYRIVCTIYKGKRKFYDVREVYYTGKKPGAMTVDEISPCGSTMEEFGRSKKMYISDLEKPVLYYDNEKDCFIEKPDWIDDINQECL